MTKGICRGSVTGPFRRRHMIMGDLLGWIIVISLAVLAVSWILVSIGIFGIISRLDLLTARLGDLGASLERLEVRLGGESEEEAGGAAARKSAQEESLREQAERIRKQKKLDYQETFPD